MPGPTEDIYRHLVESLYDYAIFALDSTGHILTWNPGAQRFKGYAADEIIGCHFSIFYPEEDVAAGKPDHELEMAAAEGQVEDEGWRVRKDGSRFWANVVITARYDDEGRLVGFTKVTRDLTKRRAAEQKALEDARRISEAEAESRAKTQFLAAMSHELRTPLNAIGGYVDLLGLGIGGAITEKQADYLDRIRHSQQHLLSVINDLLNFSRLEGGGVTYDIAPVDVDSIIDAVRIMVEPMVATKRLEIVWPTIDSDLQVMADSSKAEQILLNLLSNAVKFTEKGEIRVSQGVDGSRVVLRVTDTGIGIPASSLTAIFEPFIQVGRSFASSHEGVGLGLAISRELARAMEGDLTAESTVGEGATFTLTLPRADAGD